MRLVLSIVGVLTFAVTAFPQGEIHWMAPYSSRETRPTSEDSHAQVQLDSLRRMLVVLLLQRPAYVVDEGQCPDGWKELHPQPSTGERLFAGVSWCIVAEVPTPDTDEASEQPAGQAS